MDGITITEHEIIDIYNPSYSIIISTGISKEKIDFLDDELIED